MQSWIDGSLYPDKPVPEKITALEEKVDFLARLCGQWDFGILPEDETICEIRKKTWRSAVLLCGMLTSPSYHLLRSWHKLPPEPYIGERFPYITQDPCFERV